MKKLVIIGGEGHGSIITSCIKDNERLTGIKEWEIIGFLNDIETHVGRYPVIGKLNMIESLIDKTDYMFIWAIHLIGRNPLTDNLYQAANIPADRLATIVHYSAFIAEDVVLNPGVFVMANAYIGARANIGNSSLIKANACIGHDVKCGPLCHFAMGSITGSFSEIGVCSDIAIGATTLEYIKIGDYSIAGARSLITHDIPSNEIHIGAPARFMKKTKEN